MSAYFEALDLLNRAIALLDTMEEGIAAAHLSGVIDQLAARLTSSRVSN